MKIIENEDLEQIIKYLKMGLLYKTIVKLIDMQMDYPMLSAFDKGKSPYNSQIKYLNLKYPIRKKKLKVAEDKLLYQSLINNK